MSGLVQALSETHGALGAKAQAAGGTLLECAGDERRRRSAGGALFLDGLNGELGQSGGEPAVEADLLLGRAFGLGIGSHVFLIELEAEERGHQPVRR